MLEGGDRLCLGLEATNERWVSGEVLVEDLDGDIPGDLRLDRTEDDPLRHRHGEPPGRTAAARVPVRAVGQRRRRSDARRIARLARARLVRRSAADDARRRSRRAHRGLPSARSLRAHAERQDVGQRGIERERLRDSESAGVPVLEGDRLRIFRNLESLNARTKDRLRHERRVLLIGKGEREHALGVRRKIVRDELQGLTGVVVIAFQPPALQNRLATVERRGHQRGFDDDVAFRVAGDDAALARALGGIRAPADPCRGATTRKHGRFLGQGGCRPVQEPPAAQQFGGPPAPNER